MPKAAVISAKHQCDCGRSFVRQGDLNRHINSVHQRNKAWLCDYCPKAFSQKAQRDIHHNIHTGGKPFLCRAIIDGSSCPYKFGDPSTRVRHENEAHGEPQYHCPIGRCGGAFKRKGTLEKHIRAIHRANPKLLDQDLLQPMNPSLAVRYKKGLGPSDMVFDLASGSNITSERSSPVPEAVIPQPVPVQSFNDSFMGQCNVGNNVLGSDISTLPHTLLATSTPDQFMPLPALMYQFPQNPVPELSLEDLLCLTGTPLSTLLPVGLPTAPTVQLNGQPMGYLTNTLPASYMSTPYSTPSMSPYSSSTLSSRSHTRSPPSILYAGLFEDTEGLPSAGVTPEDMGLGQFQFDIPSPYYPCRNDSIIDPGLP